MSFGATNQDGTCLWCGRKLGWVCDTTYETVAREKFKCWSCDRETPASEYSEEDRASGRLLYCGSPCYGMMETTRRRIVSRRRRYAKPGPNGDGLFCSGGCAQAFGRQAASNGYRFKPVEVKP